MKQNIRRYENGDRDGVRRIAVGTASGYPRSDPELIADLLSNYYVEHEPEHLLVAESNGVTTGYLFGCVQTRRCRLVKSLSVFPKAVIRGLLRRKIRWREIRYFASTAYVAVKGGLRSSPPRGYPSHFHVNVAREYRRKGIGTALVERFTEVLRENRVPGVHVRVRRNDLKAADFFKSFGFTRARAYPVVVAEEKGMRASWSVVYVKDL
ncbi:MAG: GNAT family N-acetyltransferase [Candidatus Acetothermia bacterium]